MCTVVQWNPSNADTNGAEESVLEVSLFQGLKEWYLGRQKVSRLERCPQFRGVLIEGFHCIMLVYVHFEVYSCNKESLSLLSYYIILYVSLYQHTHAPHRSSSTRSSSPRPTLSSRWSTKSSSVAAILECSPPTTNHGDTHQVCSVCVYDRWICLSLCVSDSAQPAELPQ